MGTPMSMQRRILVALDDSDASLRVALFVNRFFREVDAEVLGMNVARLPTSWMLANGVGTGTGVWPFPFADGGYPAWEAAFDDRVTAAGTRVIEESGLEADETLLELGDPVAAIVEVAEERDIDLVVVGASEKGWWSRLLQGSVTAGLLHETLRPVLVVP
jgi:nucleotide-binding universal stress UspA family protein